ncbi:MAG: hypothetical protein LBQ13_00075, partial [Endomicrobium sp.]|nr:hypothetical protein [Endomicrobium sp.]
MIDNALLEHDKCIILKYKSGVDMENDKTVVNIMSCAVKFVAVTLLCVFFIFTANHYYQIKDYAASLSRDL